jgi:hypothetical protein
MYTLRRTSHAPNSLSYTLIRTHARRQLGLPWTEASFRGEAHFGPNVDLDIVMDDLDCTGEERTLQECPMTTPDDFDCAHSEDVGVICSGDAITPVPDATIRLIGSEAGSGRVEVFMGGRWGTVSSDRPPQYLLPLPLLMLMLVLHPTPKHPRHPNARRTRACTRRSVMTTLDRKRQRSCASKWVGQRSARAFPTRSPPTRAHAHAHMLTLTRTKLKPVLHAHSHTRAQAARPAMDGSKLQGRSPLWTQR